VLNFLWIFLKFCLCQLITKDHLTKDFRDKEQLQVPSFNLLRKMLMSNSNSLLMSAELDTRVNILPNSKLKSLCKRKQEK